MKIIVDLCNQHFGSLDELKRMILNAYISGADAVKVQLMDSEKYFNTTSKKYRDISYLQVRELSQYCDRVGVEFMASVFDEERLEWIEDIGVKTHKIASKVSKNDKKLSQKILDCDKPTIISTGLHEFGDFPYGTDSNIDYLFCVAKYPTFLYDPDLGKMPHFKKPGYTGYSDHSIGIAAPIRPFMRGAKILEKHFSNNIFAQNKFEGGHLGSFDKNSLEDCVKLVKQLKILEENSDW